MPAAERPGSGEGGRLRVAVAGGSIGGLCAGLALHGSGFDVQVYERHPGPMETRGAGIVVQGELVRLLRCHGAPPLPTTSCRVRRHLDPGGGEGLAQPMPQTFTSWEAIYLTLRSAYPEERYHTGAGLTGVEERDGSSVSADIEGHGPVEADVLVCADGAQSPSRRRLLPEVRPAYAGYVAWRGTLDEAAAPAGLVRFFDDAFTFSAARPGGHMLVYLIPGEGADPRPGRRRLNWVCPGRRRPSSKPTMVTEAGPADVLDARYPARRVLDLIGDKWTPIVLYCLSDEVRRFNELQRRIPDISKKMLIQVLRNLERDGLVQRTVYPEVPPKTEYRLTEDGRRLHGPVAWLCGWSVENRAFIDAVLARRAAAG